MSAVLDSTGLAVQTFDEILEEIIVAQGVALSLTAAQVERMRVGVRSTLGQIVRVWAEQEAIDQEALLSVYNSLSFFAEGAALDRVLRLLGMTRIPEEHSRVTGPAAGTNTTEIPNGTRLQYNPRGSIWLVVDGPYTISGGSVEITLEAEEAGEIFAALDPGSGFDDWTILDTIVGFSDVGSFESAEQPITGHEVETDAAFRTRAGIEAFRRGQGPLKAIEAAVSSVDGVTFVRVYENRTLVTDADSIPGKAINVVVEGGADDEVAEAIFASRSAGAEIFALADATEEEETVVDDWGFSHTVRFNRVADVDMWIRVTLTTSTAEEAAPAGVTSTVADLILEFCEATFGIGNDVLPYKIAASVYVAGIPGIDAVTVELSYDDGGTDAYDTDKRAISIRERAAFLLGRIEVLED